MKGKPFRDRDNRALHERRMKERTRIVVTQKNIEYMPTVKIWSVTSRSQIRRKMRICVEPMPFPDAAALPMSLL